MVFCANRNDRCAPSSGRAPGSTARRRVAYGSHRPAGGLQAYLRALERRPFCGAEVRRLMQVLGAHLFAGLTP